jgi:hypothetical protein
MVIDRVEWKYQLKLESTGVELVEENSDIHSHERYIAKTIKNNNIKPNKPVHTNLPICTHKQLYIKRNLHHFSSHIKIERPDHFSGLCTDRLECTI